MASRNTLKPSASPSPCRDSLSSIRSFALSFRSFWTSRRQTDRSPSPLSPGSLRLSSTRSSAKKCDLPEPLPPHAPLYRAGARSGSNTLAVSIRSVDNRALYSVDHVERAAVFITHDGLRGLAPATVKQSRSSRNAGSLRRGFLVHDARKAIDGCFGMTARQRSNFCRCLSHLWNLGYFR